MERNLRLFLDDNAERAAVAYQRMTEDARDHTIWIQTAIDTIYALDEHKDKLMRVSLEHDLGGRAYVHPEREDSGMEVVRWLEKQDVEDFEGCKFIIHSHNEISGPKMYKRLKQAGYDVELRPFGL